MHKNFQDAVKPQPAPEKKEEPKVHKLTETLNAHQLQNHECSFLYYKKFQKDDKLAPPKAKSTLGKPQEPKVHYTLQCIISHLYTCIYSNCNNNITLLTPFS